MPEHLNFCAVKTLIYPLISFPASREQGNGDTRISIAGSIPRAGL